MNIFEMFGFFMMGSFFNMILILIFLVILINKIRKALDKNIETVTTSINELMVKVQKIVSVFEKGGKNGGNEKMS